MIRVNGQGNFPHIPSQTAASGSIKVNFEGGRDIFTKALSSSNVGNNPINKVEDVFIKAVNSDIPAGNNPLNIVNLEKAEDIVSKAKEFFGSIPHVIATAGYSAPPEGYEEATRSFLDKLSKELGQKSVGFVTSPTADKGSIDAITTELSKNLANGPMPFFVTAKDYVSYINPDNFPGTIDKAAYSKVTKYVLPNAAEYSKATALASNGLVITGGRVQALDDLKNALAKGNKVAVLDNTALPSAWDAGKDRLNNAARFIAEHIESYKTGKKLPKFETAKYAQASEEFMDFLKRNWDNIGKKLKVIALDSLEPDDIAKAAKKAAKHIL